MLMFSRQKDTIGRAALAAAMVLGVAAPAAAVQPLCDCRNLDSLQADYRNAKALEAYFQKLAEHLKAYEASEAEAWGNDPKRIATLSGKENARYRSQNPPGQVMEPVRGYTGPAAVDMPRGGCTQKPSDLEALENGSPCYAMAEAALNHEAYHREICDRMGAKAYWERPYSAFALEEVEAYRQHAAELKEDLRRVLDESDVVFSAEWDLEIDVQGMAKYGYKYNASTKDIGWPSGGDTWTMTGDGTSTVTFTKAVIAGMQCTPTGAAKSTYQAKMTTDGLTFSLEMENLSTSGTLGIKCPGGGGGGPVGEGAAEAGGMIAKDVPLAAGDNVLPGDMAETMSAMMAGMGTVTGKGKRVLSVTCSQ